MKQDVQDLEGPEPLLLTASDLQGVPWALSQAALDTALNNSSFISVPAQFALQLHSNSVSVPTEGTGVQGTLNACAMIAGTDKQLQASLVEPRTDPVADGTAGHRPAHQHRLPPATAMTGIAMPSSHLYARPGTEACLPATNSQALQTGTALQTIRDCNPPPGVATAGQTVDRAPPSYRGSVQEFLPPATAVATPGAWQQVHRGQHTAQQMASTVMQSQPVHSSSSKLAPDDAAGTAEQLPCAKSQDHSMHEDARREDSDLTVASCDLPGMAVPDTANTHTCAAVLPASDANNSKTHTAKTSPAPTDECMDNSAAARLTAATGQAAAASANDITSTDEGSGRKQPDAPDWLPQAIGALQREAMFDTALCCNASLVGRHVAFALLEPFDHTDAAGQALRIQPGLHTGRQVPLATTVCCEHMWRECVACIQVSSVPSFQLPHGGADKARPPSRASACRGHMLLSNQLSRNSPLGDLFFWWCCGCIDTHVTISMRVCLLINASIPILSEPAPRLSHLLSHTHMPSA